MDGIVSSVCQIEGDFLIYKWKNVIDAHKSCLLGDGSFGYPGQMLKWMDLRVSPILYTYFLSDCAEIDGLDSFSSLPESAVLIYKWKNVMDAHRSSLLGNGSFGHPVQMLKWMDLRVPPILYTLFDQCDI